MITITNAAPSDAAFISSCLSGKSDSFLLQCGYDARQFTAPVTEPQIRAFMAARPDSHFFSIRTDGAAAGSCELTVAHSGGRTVCTLMRLVISSAMRNRGIGSAALALLAGYAAGGLHADVLRLFVYDFNEAAVHCYKKAGFAVIEAYRRGDGSTVFRMERRLP